MPSVVDEIVARQFAALQNQPITNPTVQQLNQLNMERISQGNITDNPIVGGMLSGLADITGVRPYSNLLNRISSYNSPVLRPQPGEMRQAYLPVPFTGRHINLGFKIPAAVDEALGGAGDVAQTALAATDMAAVAPIFGSQMARTIRNEVGSVGRNISKRKGSEVLDKMAAAKPQMPPGGEAVGASSRLAPSPFESSLSKVSPYVNEIRKTVNPLFENVPAEVQKNAFGKQTKVFEIVIQPEVLARRPDNAAPIAINTWQEAREFNTNPSRIAGWQQIYDNAKKITDYSGTGGFRRDPAKAGKLVDVEVGKLTEGCQRSSATVERVRHGLLPNETKIEACYGGDCWTNKTLASKFGKFENMENRDIAIADPAAIPKWFEGNAGQKRVDQLNQKEFIRMGYAGDDSHAIATGVAHQWLESAYGAGVKKPTVFISAGYAPVTDEAYRALAQHKGKFELHISNAGWFDKNEIMLRFGEFMAAREAGVPVKMRIITNKDNISGVSMANEEFLHGLLKKNNIKQHEILETPFHDDALKTNKRSEPSGKFKFVCCETGACKSCGVKCMTKVKPGKSLVGGSVAATGIVNSVEDEE